MAALQRATHLAPRVSFCIYIVHALLIQCSRQPTSPSQLSHVQLSLADCSAQQNQSAGYVWNKGECSGYARIIPDQVVLCRRNVTSVLSLLIPPEAEVLYSLY